MNALSMYSEGDSDLGSSEEHVRVSSSLSLSASVGGSIRNSSAAALLATYSDSDEEEEEEEESGEAAKVGTPVSAGAESGNAEEGRAEAEEKDKCDERARAIAHESGDSSAVTNGDASGEPRSRREEEEAASTPPLSATYGSGSRSASGCVEYCSDSNSQGFGSSFEHEMGLGAGDESGDMSLVHALRKSQEEERRVSALRLSPSDRMPTALYQKSAFAVSMREIARSSFQILHPEESTAQCSERLLRNFERARAKQGKRINARLRDGKGFRNPCIFEKLVNFNTIDQIGTHFPSRLYQPHRFSPSDFYDALSERQQALGKARAEAQERDRLAGVIKFTAGRSSAPSLSSSASFASAPSAGSGKRSSKWDMTEAPVKLGKRERDEEADAGGKRPRPG
eukprot:TRINITY_DN7474_c0_g1_i1.p1 TRINITY_DN7474_c0_g1~~TRINITY_DN7474_c0_g1_i1.p1  ORF type:complete len:397 (-),score=83.44 TRINITY_DN7474_c0_g1_i1:276-1466(-)